MTRSNDDLVSSRWWMPILFSAAVVFLMLASPVLAIEKCRSGKMATCVVDGDTIWLNGTKYRLEGYDTPEPETNVCGGSFERQLAKKASNRFVQLLNNNEWRLVPTGGKGHYKRDLARLYINGEDVGDILVRERLARYWPDGREWWCR